jgi:NAD(P)-dependent dehydrogenase (short-subunit alcohol dehydrogenase family)
MIIFITGANRGIGLYQTKYFLKDGDTVIATYRQEEESQELLALEKQYPQKCFTVKGDITSDEDVAGFVSFIKDRFSCIDILVNNAGIDIEHHNPGFEEVPLDLVAHVFDVNLLGMMRVTKALLPFVKKSKTLCKGLIANTSSGIGTMAFEVTMTRYGYMMSKAAVNMMTRVMAFEYKETGPTVIAWSPGWVKTRLGTEAATYSLDEAGQKNVLVLKSITPDKHGLLMDIAGYEMPY